jgi:hypothetical protein
MHQQRFSVFKLSMEHNRPKQSKNQTSIKKKEMYAYGMPSCFSTMCIESRT